MIHAREAETLFMFQQNLVDSYVSMHGGWADDYPLEGFTWGFASGVPQSTDHSGWHACGLSPKPKTAKFRCHAVKHQFRLNSGHCV